MIENGRSKFEKRVMRDMDARGIRYDYEKQAFSIKVPVVNGACAKCSSEIVYQCGVYTIDWYVHRPGKSGLWVEGKGTLDNLAKRRLKALVASHPGVQFHLLLMRDNWLTKKHKHRYTDWARNVGLKVAVGRIPEEWMEAA